MVKKIRKTGKQDKDYERKVKKIAEDTKPLHKPLPNKFLVLLIKDTIVNEGKKK
tara:strand:- start:2143 stop:2304 length:162 start_codon:yes stop_codon:yes gene_type:complete